MGRWRLEVKIGSGTFTDILAAGGSFVQGGYGATYPLPPPAVGNLLSGGSNGAAQFRPGTVIVNLPPPPESASVPLARWLDSNTGGTGWNIDTVQVYSTAYSCSSAAEDGVE